MTYRRFRTGWTYREVFAQFWSGDEDPTTWVNKRRRTVLGRWREIKQRLWAEHLEACERQVEAEKRPEDEVPF